MLICVPTAVPPPGIVRVAVLLPKSRSSLTICSYTTPAIALLLSHTASVSPGQPCAWRLPDPWHALATHDERVLHVDEYEPTRNPREATLPPLVKVARELRIESRPGSAQALRDGIVAEIARVPWRQFTDRLGK